MKTSRIAATAALVLTIGTLASAATRNDADSYSSCTPIMGSEVCTWVVLQGDDPIELGATIPLSLIEGVPTDVEMVWPPQELVSVAMPPEAREATGIDHLGVNWEAHGHPPATFMTRHFDFHFYNIPAPAVQAIDCADPSKPGHVPARYTLPDIDVPGMGTLVGLCVPAMGMHAMHAGEVDDTEPFDASMILGYYSGTPIFFEPMVSQSLLLRRSDFTLDMPPARDLPAGVRYPTRFRAEYLAASDEYRLVFSGFAAATS